MIFVMLKNDNSGLSSLLIISLVWLWQSGFICLECISKSLPGYEMKFEILIPCNDRKKQDLWTITLTQVVWVFVVIVIIQLAWMAIIKTNILCSTMVYHNLLLHHDTQSTIAHLQGTFIGSSDSLVIIAFCRIHGRQKLCTVPDRCYSIGKQIVITNIFYQYINGRMSCKCMSFSTVFQSYQ